MSLFASFCVLGGCSAHSKQLVWRVSSAFWGECLGTVSFSPMSHLWSIPHSLCRGISLWVGLVTPFLLLLIPLPRIRRNSISLGPLTGDQPVTVSKLRMEHRIYPKEWAKSKWSHRPFIPSGHPGLKAIPLPPALLVELAAYHSKAPPPCEISMVRSITCCNSQLHSRVRHKIAHRTLVSEVVLLNLHWGRSSVWAPSPMLFSLPTMFSLHRQYDKTPKISSFKRSVYLAHSFSHVSSRVLDPVALELGKKPARQRRAVHFMQLWSGASRKDLGSGTP